ncbi:hypothetical protein [Pseudofrankia asymbiotica]|uniref:Uncharacterized protein n=1 Tax=Pseudofrankia asymbiotica TaxID=1834516 RepID=A0A1V2I4K0_9ACTN|nr:hypothetical protein [Pseudofrankia asymbiotica]ONH25786.1 hypothetical protein BL253_26825 [Pseudofrankia asymbiotica]
MRVELNRGGFASPYATGGGGTVLEHAYGAVLLAALLQGVPVSGLGNEVRPREVRFQQSATCPVDDLVVLGDCPTGPRTIYIGVRRAPTIAAGSPAFVELLVDYLRMVVDRQAGLDVGRERLGLAVASPHKGASQVRQLGFFARRRPDNTSFRAYVGEPMATSRDVRTRLGHLDAAVAKAVTQACVLLAGQGSGTLAF